MAGQRAFQPRGVFLFCFRFKIDRVVLHTNSFALVPFCFAGLLSGVRGKMRFWGKGKHGDKKMSIRGHSADADLTKTRNGKNAERAALLVL